MNKLTGNEPINPTMWDERHKPEIVRDNDGMTIRQYYAGLAMQGLCATRLKDEYLVNGGHLHYESLATDAVGMADALISELNKEK